MKAGTFFFRNFEFVGIKQYTLRKNSIQFETNTGSKTIALDGTTDHGGSQDIDTSAYNLIMELAHYAFDDRLGYDVFKRERIQNTFAYVVSCILKTEGNRDFIYKLNANFPIHLTEPRVNLIAPPIRDVKENDILFPNASAVHPESLTSN